MEFKRGIREIKSLGRIADFSHYDKKKRRVGLALVILITALIIFTGYFLFFYERQCQDPECFVEAMKNCKRVSWIRADDQASWLYNIKTNAENDACKIEVKLLEVKQGTIDSERLQGEKMLCMVQKGETRFPEKDISRCTGILKEDMQDLIIQRMHNYLLENVGEIKQEFGGI